MRLKFSAMGDIVVSGVSHVEGWRREIEIVGRGRASECKRWIRLNGIANTVNSVLYRGVFLIKSVVNISHVP